MFPTPREDPLKPLSIPLSQFSVLEIGDCQISQRVVIYSNFGMINCFGSESVGQIRRGTHFPNLKMKRISPKSVRTMLKLAEGFFLLLKALFDRFCLKV
jgi:hypothetical protein